MAITIQSVSNLKEGSATSSQSYASSPDATPFALFFASQMQTLVPGNDSALSSSALIDGAPAKSPQETAQDASFLLGSMMSGLMAGQLPATRGASQTGEALAETAVQADGISSVWARQAAIITPSENKAKLAVDSASTLAALTQKAGDAVPVARTLVLDAGNAKKLARGLSEDGLSAAVAARLALREAGEDAKTLPPAVAAMRQDLPATVNPGIADGKDVRLPGLMDRSKQWGEAFGQQLVKAVERQLETARFHVTPEKLGPIEVQISMNKDQAQILLMTSNAMAKDIVESHLPALSRMMEQAGLQLADAQVSSQQRGQQQSQQQQDPSRSGRDVPEFAGTLLGEEIIPATVTSSSLSGLRATA